VPEHATGSRAATETVEERAWAFDVLDEIDPRQRFSPSEVNIAIRCIIAAKRKAEYETAHGVQGESVIPPVTEWDDV
jgi:hypothetical protein